MKSQPRTNARTTRRVALTILGTILCLASSFGLFTSAAQAQDFTFSGVSPTSLTLPRGTSTSTTVTIAPGSGFSGVTLTVGGLPSGVTFGPMAAGAGNTTLTLTATNSATLVIGATVTITATDSTSTQALNVSLNVVENPVPFIDTVSPLSSTPGSGGFSLTVYGGGFISGFSQIYWTPLSPPSSSVELSGITCTAAQCSAFAPSGLTQGTAVITVVNTGRPVSNVFFFTIIGSAPAVNSSAAKNSPITVGNGPSSVAVADFNGDGVPDLAVTNRSDNTVFILLGNGDGTFTPQTHSPFATGLTPVSVAVGDFNNDGNLDLAVINACGTDLTCASEGTVSILLGDGHGNFAALSTSPSTGYTPTFVAVGDLDGDGNLDLAVVNGCGGTDPTDCAKGPTDGTVSVLLGDGTGAFTLKTSPGTDPNPSWVAVGDFKNDGTLDLAVTNAGTATSRGTTLTVMLGNGDGAFSTTSITSRGISPAAVAVGDFNNDGKLDLAVANACGTDTTCSSPGKVAILEGDGSGGFTLLSNTPAGTGPSALAVADLNGDGNLDVAVADGTGSKVSILLGNGAGSLSLQATPASPSTGNSPVSIAIADFNGDGGLDLVTANKNSSNVSVLLAVPTVTFACPSETVGTCTISTPPSSTPPTLSFGSEPAGGTAGPMTVTVTNSSNLTLTFSNTSPTTPWLAVTTGATSFAFDSGTTTCGAAPFVTPFSLAAGASCTIGVNFNPQTPSSLTGIIEISDNGGGSPQSIDLKGTGAAAAANVSPNSLAFGNVSINTDSPAQTVTLSNTGATALTISSIAATSPYVAHPNGTDGSTCSGTLAGNSTCLIAVTFDPTTAGFQGGTLTVLDNIGGSQSLTQTVTLTGTGLQAVANVSPGSLTFNNQLLGTTSVAQPVQVSNTGAGALAINNIGITGTNGGEFNQTNDCGSSVPGLGNCTIYVTFSPSGTVTTATQAATLTIADSDNTGSQTVMLTGTEIYPVAGVTSTSPFTAVFGSTSAPQTVTLSNTGGFALNINSIAIGGANASEFAETTTCLASLPANSTCTISVTFTASATLPALATLTITDNSKEVAGSTQIVPLSGSVTKSSTLTTITANTPNPSIVGLPVMVNFTVRAIPPGIGTPTGTVTISDGLDSCTGTLSQGDGSCSITFSLAGGPGSKSLTATFIGDSNFLTSTAGATQTVIKANTSTTITSNLPNPQMVGLPVIVKFAVSMSAPLSSPVGTPSGSVTVSDGTGDTCTGTLSGGVGSCTMTPLTPSSPGAKALIATYSGDTNFNTSISPAAAQTVTKANTTTAITSISPGSVVVGQPVTVGFSVTPPTGDILTPTGIVTVSDGVGDSCSAGLSLSAPDIGIGSCTFKPSAPGPLTITASYPGDSNFNASSATASGASALKVGDFSFSVGPPTETISSGHTATFTVTGNSLGGFSGNVALTCSDPAPKTICSISPNSVTVGGTVTSIITVVASKAAAHGSWTLTFTGTYGSGIPATGGLTHTTSAFLSIK